MTLKFKKGFIMKRMIFGLIILFSDQLFATTISIEYPQEEINTVVTITHKNKLRPVIFCEDLKPSWKRRYGDHDYAYHRLWVYKSRKKVSPISINGIPQAKLSYNITIDQYDCSDVKEAINIYYSKNDAKLDLIIDSGSNILIGIKLYN